ncbi:hypothetical protein GCM10010970_01900 [Silvimonas iriomotensis]|uniref:DUF4279 domain-containing protein n=1 Tax=Silvimonas iriomotensis TaxID=449662 RepID=A0ABQ2P4S4_9NEIS|nr:hypothetical protein GCM10010970_01900 [Silvimonas iriomotensis]
MTPKGQLLPGIYERAYSCFDIPRAGNEDLAETLDRVLNTLIQHEALFTRIREQGGRTEFFIGWYSTGNTGEIFSSVLLTKLAKLQIDLALDVYGETRE